MVKTIVVKALAIGSGIIITAILKIGPDLGRYAAKNVAICGLTIPITFVYPKDNKKIKGVLSFP